MEAVFVLPVLIMLVFGMVTYGLALSQGNAIENAARETSRFGATHPVTTTTDWLDAVSAVAVSSATGDLEPTADDRYICVALVGTDNHDGRKQITGASTVDYTAGNCPDMTCPTSAPCVQVVLERSAKLEAVAFQRSVTISGSGVSSFEREP